MLRSIPIILCVLGAQLSSSFHASAEGVHDRAIRVQGDEVASHRLGPPPLIHKKLPEGFTALNVLLHVVVDASGNVESATAWDVERESEQWAKEQAEEVEKSQKFRPFKRWGKSCRAKFDDAVWIVPPEEWARERVTFPAIKNWKTLRIRLARTACYGMCPVYSVEVLGNGKVLFDGQENVPEAGRLHGYVSQEEIAHLVSVFRSTDYFSLKNEYVSMITDNPTCITSIQFDGHTKSVKDYVGFTAGMPEGVLYLEAEIDRIARENQWIR